MSSLSGFLVMWKGSEVVIPHLNWRGLFGKGTTLSGSLSTAQIEWPGFNTGAYHNRTRSQATYRAWYGSVLEGKRDAGGTMYMRNRYYDPATGQFTQTDPIGIAGGLNVYGFGAGDPVTYSDPYGLKAADDCDPPGSCAAKGALIGGAVGGAVGAVFATTCTAGTGGVCALGAPGIVGFFTSGGAAVGGLIGTWAESVAGDDSTNRGLPWNGPPNGTLVRDGGRGKGQIRDYGPDGQPKTDYDFGHDHNESGDPHAHDYDQSKPQGEARGPARPVQPNETNP